MRKLRRLGVASGAALLAAALIAPVAAQADTGNTTVQQEHYGAQASSQVLNLDLLGREIKFGDADVNSALDAVANSVNASATGVGTELVPSSKATAGFGNPNPVTQACPLPQVQQVTGLLSGTGQGLNLPLLGNGVSLGGLLPTIGIDVGCASANVAGTPQSFMAESIGGTVQVHVALPAIVSSLASSLEGTVNSLPIVGNGQGGGGLGGVVGNLPVVGGLLGGGNNSANVGSTVSGLNNILGNLLGSTANVPVVGPLTQGLNLNSIAGALSPSTTVDNLLNNLQGDLLTIDLGVSTAKNSGDLQSYLSEAVSQGGSIALLPNLLGPNKPLLRIDIAKSDASVSWDRSSQKPTGSVSNSTVRVTSALLNNLGLGSIPVVGGLLGDTGLPVVGQVLPMVDGLLNGIPSAASPLTSLLGTSATIKGLGLNSGTDSAGNGYIELAPGMSVSLLCSGAVAPLCTQISVGAAQDPKMNPDGSMTATASEVSVSLLSGLGGLNSSLPVVGPVLNGLGLNLGTILGSNLVGGLLSPLTGAAGLGLGTPTSVPGIRVTLAGAMAQSGGTKVLGASVEQARQLTPQAAPAPKPLPRTGGLPFDATEIPVLLGASAGLRGLIRRRRRNQA